MKLNFWIKTNRTLLLLFAIFLSTLINSCGGETKSTDNGKNEINSRLDTIKNRGVVICGVNGQLPGFSFVDESGQYSGLDVDICRAMAAAIFDNPAKVEFRNLSTQERFTAVQSGEIDLLSRNTTWTISRDTSVGMEFLPTVFYDGQGMMVKADSKITKLDDLQNKSICVQTGTTTELNLSDQMRRRNITYSPVVFDDEDGMYAAYLQGRCEGVTGDRSQLTSRRSNFPEPDNHTILDVVMSKEPLGPAVANGDNTWSDAAKWIIFALTQAEEYGITSENLETFKNTQDPSIRRFLGLEGNLGQDMGLPNDFTARIIKHVGSYGEIYDRNIGIPLKLQRGPNELWSNGGLLYSPPFR